ncbi:hypothetical protein HBN50_09220 [Halobacteriovorax sp. GB3]|uniref:hypothetical protein n=1 Tax=Halobacteriovorax sp. GB3 TaxID=2719615 RepID=UPI00235EF897|nr:hypothetical protein [Halobacteriovorax sp. GB3]MDD0853278.1 hypothetical protein [Halobacteriovorax sp. GB3]
METTENALNKKTQAKNVAKASSVATSSGESDSQEVIMPFWKKLGDILWAFILKVTPQWVKDQFLAFDRKVDGAISFFFKHWGKSRFMISMSKKVQYLGVEKLYFKSPKAFVYFFLFYLVRDTILYIIIPIFFAKATTGN